MKEITGNKEMSIIEKIPAVLTEQTKPDWVETATHSRVFYL